MIAAQKSYEDEMTLAKRAGASLQTYAQIKTNVVQKTEAAQTALKAETAELLRQNDVVGNYLRQTAEAASTIGLDDRQKQIAEAVNKATEAWLKLNPAVPRLRSGDGQSGSSWAASGDGRRREGAGMSILEHVDAIDLALRQAEAIVTLIRRAPGVHHDHQAHAAAVAEDLIREAQVDAAALWREYRAERGMPEFDKPGS